MNKNYRNNTMNRVAKAAGFQLDEMQAAATTAQILNKALYEFRNTKLPTNLPLSIYRKVVRAADFGARGLYGQRYHARHYGLTLDEVIGRGDAVDQYGNRVEIKEVRQKLSGQFQVHVRPDDDVAYHHIHAYTHDGEHQFYVVPQSELSRLCGGKNKDIEGMRALSWNPHVHRLEHMLDFRLQADEMTDHTTGLRYGSLKFLSEAGVTTADVDHMVDVMDALRETYTGHRKLSHLTMDELTSLRRLFEAGKFGLLVQDWVNDRLEIARAATPGIGDGRGIGSVRIETKYASITRDSSFLVNAIRLGQFDELVIVLDFQDDGVEVVRVSHKMMSRLINEGYGTETADDVFQLKFGAGDRSKILKRLRRHKVDLGI